MSSSLRTRTIQRDIEASNGVPEFQSYAHFVSIDPARNRRRFYTIAWQKSFWDGGAVIRSWGRLGGKGRQLTTFYLDRSSAQDKIERMVKRRLQRGYQLVETS